MFEQPLTSTHPPSLRAQRDNPAVERATGLPRRSAPRNDGQYLSVMCKHMAHKSVCLLGSLSLLAMFSPSAANACSSPRKELAAQLSDVIVKGRGQFDIQNGQGIIKSRKVLKGPRLNSFKITLLKRGDADQQEACPLWFPMEPSLKGIFYLETLTDGSHAVLIAKVKSTN